jgi:hypothetical protein
VVACVLENLEFFLVEEGINRGNNVDVVFVLYLEYNYIKILLFGWR